MTKETLTSAAFDALMEAPSLAISAVDNQGRVILWSPSASRMFGWTESEMLGRLLQELPLVPEGQRHEIPDRIQRQMEGSSFNAFETCRLRKDGTLIKVSLWTSPLRDNTGEVIGTLAVTADITARKEAEQAVHEGEIRFRTLTSSAPVGIFLTDPQGDCLYVNERWMEIAGMTAEEAVGQGWARAIHVDDRGCVFKEWYEATHRGEEFSLEYRFQTPQGRITWVHGKGVAQRNDAGAITGYIGTIMDITARKQADEALREVDAQLRRVLTAIPDYLYSGEFDADGRFSYGYYSPAAERITGRPTEFLLTGSEAWLSIVHAEDRPRLAHAFQRLQRGASVSEEEEYRFVLPDGQVRWVRDKVTASQLPQGGRRIDGVVSDITSRKRTEDALRASEERFRALIEKSFDLIALVNADQMFKFVSPSVARVLGYEPGELVGRNALELVHPDDLSRITEAFNHVKQAPGANVMDEFRYRHKDGSYRWLAGSGTNCLAESHVGSIIANFHDVTLQMEAEAVLRESEERYRLLAEAIPVPVWRSKASGEFLDCNERWYSYTGQSSAEVAATLWMKAIHPDDQAPVGERVRHHLKTGVLYEVEYRLWHAAERRYRWNLARGLPVKDKDGRILYWVGCVFDVDDQKRAEGTLRNARDELELQVRKRTKELVNVNAALREEVAVRKQREEALRESEERFRQMATAVNQVFWMSSADLSKVLYVSPAYERIWGRTCASLYRRPKSFLEAIHPADREKVSANLRQPQIVWSDERDFSDVQYRIRRPDGEVRWIRVRGYPVWDDAGKIYRVAGTAEDITERKQLEGEILDVSSREQRRIGEDIHDSLCQQLTGIAFLCKAVEEKLAARALPETADAEKIGQLVNATINEARDLARGLCPVELGQNDLGLALKALGSLVERLFDVSCTVRYGRLVKPKERVALIHLYRIAQEAINNAIRHGKAKHISIDLVWRQKELTLRMRDNGVGFSQRKAFKQGMGIRIMRHRAEMIGATLTVESKPGTGTTVTCVYTQPSSRSHDYARRHRSK